MAAKTSRSKTSRSKRRVSVAISLGDPCGIGPEVIAGALAKRDVARLLRPIVFGDDRAYARACRAMGVRDELMRLASVDSVPTQGGLVCITQLSSREMPFGKPTPAGGNAQGRYLESAIDFVRAGNAAAITTAPVNKAALHAAGWHFPGHTELLAERFFAPRVAMMLAGPTLRVVLATTHLALQDVAGRLNPVAISEILLLTHRELRDRFRIKRPKIAVCALNPHAGEGGLFGDEEARLIAPGILLAKKQGVDAEGPFAADGLFPRAIRDQYDAVLAMYHDQGLIPVKLLHFDTAVNVTLGLPVVRTSPDHGVAYDIAGKGKADPASMAEALRLAANLAGQLPIAGR